MKQNGFTPIVLVVVLAVVSVAVAYLYGVKQGKSLLPSVSPVPTGKQVVCTQDVKQCPDGSYVGRQEPNCEFAPCPGEIDDRTERKTSQFKSIYEIGSDKGKFTLSYPSECVLPTSTTSPEIKCQERSLVIFPQAGGRGAEVIKRDKITMAGITWERIYFVLGEKPSMGVTYGADVAESYQLIEVNYDNYSLEVEGFAEEMIATFKSI